MNRINVKEYVQGLARESTQPRPLIPINNTPLLDRVSMFILEQDEVERHLSEGGSGDSGDFKSMATLTPTPTPTITASATLTPTPTPTPTSPSFGSSGFQWMTINSVNNTTASGDGQNGITISITQSGGGMGAHPGMYQPQVFPLEYGIPPNGAQILNSKAGTFTATFSQPVTNALVAFASVGNPSLSVPVQVSVPFTPIWSRDTTYANPVIGTNQYNTFTGTEGFNIIRIDGTVTSVIFNYTVDEYYCTICFGFEDQNTLP